MAESWEGGLEEFPGRSGVSLRTGVPVRGSGNQGYTPPPQLPLPPPSSQCSQESECAGWSPRSWIVSGGSTWTVCAGRSLESCSRNIGVGDSERRWPAALVHPKQKEALVHPKQKKVRTCRASFQPSPSVQRDTQTPGLSIQAHRVALPTHGSLTHLSPNTFFPISSPATHPRALAQAQHPAVPSSFCPTPEKVQGRGPPGLNRKCSGSARLFSPKELGARGRGGSSQSQCPWLFSASVTWRQ